MAKTSQASATGVYTTLSELIALRNQNGLARVLFSRSTHHPLPGNIRSQQRGRGMEFVEVRPYQAGDDVRSIDWRVTARTGKPYTKLHAEERERPVYIAVDQRANMFFGSRKNFKSVVAAKTAALAGWSALANGDRVGGLVASETLNKIRIGRKRNATLQLIDAIATANLALNAHSQSTMTLSEIFSDSLAHTPVGATVLVISDFIDINADAVTSLHALGHKRTLVLIKITDPLETRMPIKGHVTVSDGIHPAWINVSSRSRQSYLQTVKRAADQLHQCAERCGARLLTISTEGDPSSISGLL